jgi:dTMP kinase
VEPAAPTVDDDRLMPRPVLVALEGGEGAGKSTQAALLAERLDAVLTREPGGTPVGEAVRRLLLEPEGAGLDARTEALLFAADRAAHVAHVIEPALAAGRSVVTDRYVESSIAYQAFGRGLPLDEVRALSTFATRGRSADVVVVLDVDPALGGARRGRPPDRMESEDAGFHERVRAGFAELAAAEPDRIAVVDASGDVSQVAALVWAAVEERLPD